MKKILLLGGSTQQIVAIEKAKNLGYYTILCDFLADNPGQYHADKFYLVSTTDKEAVLKVADDEKIDGVLAYASDPAAPTAAYVAEKLGLITNPYSSVEILCNKDKFRKFLRDNGFNAPLAKGYDIREQILKDIDLFHLPVIVKPVDSSGSKGITVVYDWDDISKAIDFAFEYSRSHKIIVEEYIEKKHPYLIGGDVFIVNGKIVLWGLLNCHRDSGVNSLVPVGKSYPLELEYNDIQNVKDTLQRLVDKLELKQGSMNVELIVDKDNRVWPIDIGPRAGGNMIPDLLGMIYDVDIVEMAVKASMGKDVNVKAHESNICYATYNLHSSKNGIFKDIRFSSELEKYIIKKCIYKKDGDMIEYFDNASKAIGIIFMKCNEKKQLTTALHNIEKEYEVILYDNKSKIS